MSPRAGPILIAGGGIAGLTAALAFARRGAPVRLFERADEPQEAGAGIQLSPNATRLLERLGVLQTMASTATRPQAVVLRDAATLREIARVPLGAAAEARWGAPYLALHRADLREALAQAAAQHAAIDICLGATVADATLRNGETTARVERGERTEEATGSLLVAADGVWSRLRQRLVHGPASRFSGRVAWRATLPAGDPALAPLTGALGLDCVTTFLHPRAHLVAYPIHGGASVNLVGLARGKAAAETWAVPGDAAELAGTFAGAGALGETIRRAGHWTVWPIHTVDPDSPWLDPRGAVLIGDAAHAMTPFAAQGGAAAIEDAYVLAACIAGHRGNRHEALVRYEALRRPRIRQMARRGAFNAFAWHAAGPVALARNAVLAMRGGGRLAADLDWLYGWDSQ